MYGRYLKVDVSFSYRDTIESRFPDKALSDPLIWQGERIDLNSVYYISESKNGAVDLYFESNQHLNSVGGNFLPSDGVIKSKLEHFANGGNPTDTNLQFLMEIPERIYFFDEWIDYDPDEFGFDDSYRVFSWYADLQVVEEVHVEPDEGLLGPLLPVPYKRDGLDQTDRYHDYFWWFIPSPDDPLEVNVRSLGDIYEGTEEVAEERFLEFEVSLSGASDERVSVSFSNSPGPTSTVDEALPFIDYLPVDQTIEFLPGEISKTVRVPIFADSEPENDEIVTASISGATLEGRQYVIVGQEATGRILNDDLGLELERREEPIELVEGQVPPAFAFSLERATSFPIVVTATLDYPGFNQVDVGSSTIPANTTSISLENLIVPVLDGLLEANMAGTVFLQAESNGEIIPISGEVEKAIDFELSDNALNNPSGDGFTVAGLIKSLSTEIVNSILQSNIEISEERTVSYAKLITNHIDEEDFLDISASARKSIIDALQRSVDRIAAAVNIAIDVKDALDRFNELLVSAEIETDPEERVDILYEASREAFSDLNDITASTILGLASAAGGTAAGKFAAGYLATTLGITALGIPAIAGIIAPVAVGAAGIVTYNLLFQEAIRNKAQSIFEFAIPIDLFEELVEVETPDLKWNFLDTESNESQPVSIDHEAFILNSKDFELSGTLAMLDGDHLVNFGIGDSISISGQTLSTENFTLRSGSTIIEIDENLDGETDSTITLTGADAPRTLFLAQVDGNTVLSAAGPGTRISIEEAAQPTPEEPPIGPPVEPPAEPTVEPPPIEPIQPSQEADMMSGSASNELMSGLGGDDTMRAGGGSDTMQGGEGDDRMFGQAGDDRMLGQSGNDVMVGGGGADTLIGGGGDDNAKGGGGSDVINGGAGNDTILGNGGNDSLRGNGGNDDLRGGGGSDDIRGGGGNDLIAGNGGADDLRGGGGSDTISGGGGADIVRGNGGADVLQGQGGNDTLIGGGGRDTFQFRASDRADVIQDFRQGQDMIEILSGANAFAALDIEQDGRDVLISFGAAGQIRVVTDQASAFTEDDFLFS